MARFNHTYVLTRIKERFPRTDSVLEAMLASDVFDNIIREVCSLYPYWFLTMPPGYTYPGQFPTTEALLTSYTKVLGDWLDRGWLHVQPNKDRYILAAPAELGDADTDADYWSYVQCQQVDFVKKFNLNGTFVHDLEVIPGTRQFTVANYSSKQQPRMCFWETGEVDGERVSWLRFCPTPDAHAIYAVQFTLRAPIEYYPGSVGSGLLTNRFLEEYPEVYITAGLLAAAIYFGEAQEIGEFHAQLWGSPDDGRKGKLGKQREGKLAKIKRDTEKWKRQQMGSVPQFLGARGAVGRHSGGRSRSPQRSGLYYQNF